MAALARRALHAGTVRPVLTYPHPLLAARCPPVADARAPALLAAAADLLATVTAGDEALGLAAPQIGLSQRVFVVRRPLARTEAEARALLQRRRGAAGRGGGAGSPPQPPSPPEFLACIDPQLVSRRLESAELGIEACLSQPQCPGLVRRYTDVEVSYVDAATGQPVRERLCGLPAVVFQHELDHLDGVLHTDREVTAFPRRSREAEWDTAQQRFLLGLVRFYGVTDSQALGGAVEQ